MKWRQHSGRAEIIHRKPTKALLLLFRILIISLIVLIMMSFVYLNIYLTESKAKFTMNLIKEHTALYDRFYKKLANSFDALANNKQLELLLCSSSSDSIDDSVHDEEVTHIVKSAFQDNLEGTLVVVVHNRSLPDHRFMYRTFMVNPLESVAVPVIDYLFDDPLYDKALSLSQPVIGHLSHVSGADCDCMIYHYSFTKKSEDDVGITYFLFLPGEYIRNIYRGVDSIKETTLVITDLFNTPLFINHPDDSDDYLFDYDKQIYLNRIRPGVKVSLSNEGLFAANENYKELSYYRKLVTDASIIHMSSVQKMQETFNKRKGAPVWKMLSYKRGTYLATYYRSTVSSVSVFDFKPFSSFLYPGVLFCAFMMLVSITYLIYLYINLLLTYRSTIVLPEKFIERYNLSERETEIIYAVLDNLSNQEIAHRHFISIGTVKTHINNIFKKIGCSSRTALIKLVKKFN